MTFGLAVLAHAAREQRDDSGRGGLGRLEFISAPATTNVLKVAALGEAVADKLPQTPARTEPPGLIGRTVAGALCGAVLSRSVNHTGRGDTLTGAALGALGAAVGTFAFYRLRRTLTRDYGLPDTAVALAEDALALTVAISAVTRVGR